MSAELKHFQEFQQLAKTKTGQKNKQAKLKLATTLITRSTFFKKRSFQSKTKKMNYCRYQIST